MAVGRPVVASRVGGIPEIVMDAQTGLLVEPRRPEQLAAAVTHVLSDCALAHTMGAAGRERAQRLFGIERHIARVQAVYDQILDERSGT
jgi:glycosyltransferase involved in cell wall biosynthesis